jgi:hypothetical protein
MTRRKTRRKKTNVTPWTGVPRKKLVQWYGDWSRSKRGCWIRKTTL